MTSAGSYDKRGFVEVLAAQQSPTSPEWFQGTADAVRQYLWLFEEAVREGVEDFLILSGDHLYRMDYREFVDAQRAQEEPFIASMGIYVFNARKMIELLTETFPTANDFGSEVIPGANRMGMKVQAHLFDGYWEDIGTIKAFYESNLALCDAANPSFSFYDKDYPIYTMTRFLPPSKLVECNVERSMIGDGCVIRHGTSVTGSMVGLRSLIGSNSTIEEALIMGADYYETLEECALVAECIPMSIGSNTTLRKCIIDKNARIGSNVQIVNAAGVQEANHEEEGYIIKDGIVVVVKDAVISDGTII